MPLHVSSTPAKEPHTQMPDEICHDCSKYDLQAALAVVDSAKYLSAYGHVKDEDMYPSDGILIANVGKRYRTPFETNCPLCRILLASRKSSLDLYPTKNQDIDGTYEQLIASQKTARNSYSIKSKDIGDTYMLRAPSPSQRSAFGLYLASNQDEYDTWRLGALLASHKSALDLHPVNNRGDELRAFILLKDTVNHDVSLRGSIFAWRNRSIYIDLVSSRYPLKPEQRRAHGAKHGFAVIRQPRELPKFTAQVVPAYFDPTVAKQWICHCREHHRNTCSSQKDTSAISLRLIDCESLVVEQGHSQSSYVALSYVWGSSTARDQYSLMSTSSSTFSLPSILPAVILDAIAVTKSLGYRYLWVDKFCIDQANDEVKHQQIAQMDSVYENAELTIIAAAGFDEAHGLPGVGSRARSTQPIARMGGLTVVSTMRDIQDSIRSSKWFTRGWTFQEALLTRRRLVFTEEQVYFECGAMNCHESFSGSIDALHKEYGSTSPQYLRAGIFERSGWQKFVGFRSRSGDALNIFVRYLTTVEDYTARELRYEHDSLNAFAGIIKKFERAREPIIQLWGIPTTIKRRELTESCFVEALCWSHAQSCWSRTSRPFRRPGFPSWSWAGWAGKVEYAKMPNSKHMETQLPSIQLSEWQHSILNTAVHANISLESKAGQIMELSEIAKSTSIDRFDVAYARVLRLQANVFPSSSFSYEEKRGWKLLGLPAVVSLSQGPDSQSRFFSQLVKRDSSLQCVHIRDLGTIIFGLILETQGGITSRVGLFTADWYGYREPNYSILEWKAFRIL